MDREAALQTLLSAKCGYELGGFDFYCVCYNDINALTCSPNTLFASSCGAYQKSCKSHCNGNGFGSYLEVCRSGVGNDGITIPDSLSNTSYDALFGSPNKYDNPPPTFSTTPVSSSASVSSTSPVASSTPKEQSSSQPNVSLSSMIILLMLVFSSLYINTN